MIWFNTCEQSDQSDQPQSLRCWQKAKTRFFRGELIVNNTLQLLYQRNATLVIISIDRQPQSLVRQGLQKRKVWKETVARREKEADKLHQRRDPSSPGCPCQQKCPTFVSKKRRHGRLFYHSWFDTCPNIRKQAGREKYHPERERGEIFFRIKTRERRQREGISLGNTKMI